MSTQKVCRYIDALEKGLKKLSARDDPELTEFCAIVILLLKELAVDHVSSGGGVGETQEQWHLSARETLMTADGPQLHAAGTPGVGLSHERVPRRQYVPEPPVVRGSRAARIARGELG